MDTVRTILLLITSLVLIITVNDLSIFKKDCETENPILIGKNEYKCVKIETKNSVK